MNITPEAATAIEGLLSGREGGGLRLFPKVSSEDGDQLEIRLALSDEPDPNDEVIAQHGSKVFVEQQLSPLLEDRTLDVTSAGDGQQVAFHLVP